LYEQNNPDTPAIGFVVKDAGKTFGFTITKDAEEKEVVYGNPFFIHTKQGPVPDWHRHLKYFMDTGKKAMTGNVKNLGDDYFAKLSQKVGYKTELILTVLSQILFNFSSSNRAPDWERIEHSIKGCEFLNCKIFSQIFNKENFKVSVDNFRTLYPNLNDFKSIQIPNSNNEIQTIRQQYPEITGIEERHIKSLLDILEYSFGQINNDYKECVQSIFEHFIKSLNQKQIWDILNNYSTTIKQFLESQKI
jgi:hypothetical protein